MSDAETIVNAITAELDKLNKQSIEDFSGDTLSKIGVKLASYKAGLGRHSTLARKAVWVAEKNLKIAKAQAYKSLRDISYNVGDSKELKVIEVEKEMNELIESQALEDSITTLSYNVHDLIDSIKSRLINLQMEKQESNTH